MRNLTVGDLKLVLRELLTDKLPDLRASATGKMYEPRLRAKQTAIEAIPDVASPEAPFAKELSDADIEHDGVGAAAYFLCRAIQVHPTLPASLKDAAKNAMDTFVPQLDVLRKPYADEAAAALGNRSEVTKLKAELKSIATPGGGTLLDWVKDFVAAGDKIDKYLRERAKVQAKSGDASSTGALRASTIGLLGRFRDALRDEIEEGESKLAADHDAALFAYIDKLTADREAASRARASGPPTEGATAGGPDTGAAVASGTAGKDA